MLVDLHTHPVAHGSGSYELEHLIAFLTKAREKGIGVIGFSDHDRYLERINFDIKNQLNSYYPELQVRIGLEVDYFPEKELKLRQLLGQYQFDYVIGSVHNIADWPFDVPDYIHRYQDWDVDELHRVYFETLTKAAQSGLFQIVGHLDLIKIFNFRPKQDIMGWVEPVLRAIKQSDLTVEINSAGLHKPVAEVYPEERIIARCFELNIPVTISSDAHEASHVGRYGAEIASLLKKIGYNQIAVYTAQQRKMLPL
ncbi:histidinol-phosphatase HisJ family protein [Zhaonella formicivorans]|uniref:histidinol-phosphatase HisJ family protein n=1 Tax=Zhaonella formicivorans TaxID=2528593 RepID=UPI001D12D49D|nr:histidinol-phosphatase HisJ family protein [Zhaonella formicivorans]